MGWGSRKRAQGHSLLWGDSARSQSGPGGPGVCVSCWVRAGHELQASGPAQESGCPPPAPPPWEKQVPQAGSPQVRLPVGGGVQSQPLRRRVHRLKRCSKLRSEPQVRGMGPSRSWHSLSRAHFNTQPARRSSHWRRRVRGWALPPEGLFLEASKLSPGK